jgi:hypothetical protein
MQEQEKIPVFKSWKAWYIFVLVLLVLQIIAFHLFTRYFS